MSYAIEKKTTLTYEQALERVEEALKAEGFGVLTKIDIKDTLKKKIDVDFRRYTILGACNPPLAHKALSAELLVGLMLPCNVVVCEGDDGKALVAAIDPSTTVAGIGNPALVELAATVKGKLGAALDRLG